MNEPQADAAPNYSAHAQPAGPDGDAAAESSATPNAHSADPLARGAAERPQGVERPQGAESLQGDERPQGAAPPAEPKPPGCMPAIIAATMLMAIVAFVAFGFAGWLIFQKRSELAGLTLRGAVLPELQQSNLDPETKQATVGLINDLADDIDAGQYENWQAGGIMQRLIQLPMLRWGDLQAIDRWAAEHLDGSQAAQTHKQITRFFRAVELERAIASDLYNILQPASREADDSQGLPRLLSPLTADAVAQVTERCRLVADRAEIPDQAFDQVSLTTIVRRQIEAGKIRGPRR